MEGQSTSGSSLTDALYPSCRADCEVDGVEKENSYQCPMTAVMGLAGEGLAYQFLSCHFKKMYHIRQLDPRAVLFAGLALLAVSNTFGQKAPKTLGKDDWATPPYITLSQRDAPYVNALPILGKVEWTLSHLDFIEAGPTAGISGAALVHRGNSLFLAGGFIPNGDETNELSRRTSRWAFRYDLRTRQWHKITNMPGRKEYTRGIAHDSGLYVVGGLCQKSTASD